MYACELSGVMVKLSRDVFTAKNMSDKVTLLLSLSTKLSIPKDIPKRYKTVTLFISTQNFSILQCLLIWL